MSDQLPILARWYYRWPWTRALVFCYCLGISLVGLIGLTDPPSPGFVNTLGWYAVLLFSATLLVSGLIGAAGVFRSIRATVISIWAIAAATFFHGAALWSQGSFQTGLRLMVAPVMMVPLVWAWEQWLTFVKRLDSEGPPPAATKGLGVWNPRCRSSAG